jgi:chromate transporter
MTRLLYGIKPVAFALVVHGILQLGSSVAWSPRSTAIALAAFAALAVTQVDVLLLFLIAGLAYAPLRRNAHMLLVPAPLIAYAKIMITGGAVTGAVSAAMLLWEFLKIGAVIYGGGFALIGVLQQTFVEHLGWVTQRQLLDAIAVGQSTPGPVFTTATFLGYLLAGIPGAVAATVGIFSPAFVFVRLEQLLLSRLRRSRFADSFSRFLQGVNLAVLAALAHASITLGRDALTDPFALLLCTGALVALAWKKVDAHWLVGVGLLIGLSRLALF